MAAPRSPSKALLRRHKAAMRIIRRVPPHERWQLLYGVCWPSPAVEAACEAAEEARLEKIEARAHDPAVFA